jgi:phage portal protein BeeE
MDSVTQMEVLDKSKGIMAPNEQRKRLDLKPKAGGDSPMLQQQNFSLEALAKRDAQADPFGTAPAPAPAAEPPKPEPEKQFNPERVKGLFAGRRDFGKAA